MPLNVKVLVARSSRHADRCRERTMGLLLERTVANEDPLRRATSHRGVRSTISERAVRDDAATTHTSHHRRARRRPPRDRILRSKPTTTHA